MSEFERSPRRSLICLHGWLTHGGFFDPIAARLDAECRVLAPDLPGHGANRYLTPAGSIADLAHWLHDYMAAEVVERPVLLGWSMGAMVAMEYISCYGQDSLAGLIIQDMTPKLLNDGEWELGFSGMDGQASNENALAAMASDWEGFLSATVSRFFARSGSDHGIASWAAREVLENDQQIMAGLWRSMSQQDYRPLLGRIEIPTLIIAGAESQLYSVETSRYFQRQMVNATLQQFRNSGHTPHLEEPERFVEVITEFIGTL